MSKVLCVSLVVSQPFSRPSPFALPRTGSAPVEDSDEDSEDDEGDDDFDEDDFDDEDGEEQEEEEVVEPVDEAALAPHLAVMTSVVTAPASLTAAALISTLDFLEPVMRAPNVLEFFSTEQVSCRF
jgi:hypothetical protein